MSFDTEMFTQEVDDLVTRFKRFLWEYMDRKTRSFKYRERLSQMALMSQKSLIIDFDDITLFDRRLAHIIEDNPEIALDAASRAIKELLLKENPDYAQAVEKFYPRFRNLSRIIRVRELTSEYIGKMVAIEGILTRLTRVEAKLVKARYKHLDPECGAEFDYPEYGEMGERIEKPAICPICGKGGKFQLLPDKSKFIDWQKIVVQEKPEEVPPGQIPRSIEVVLTGDLVDIARPGDRITITGILRVMPTASIQKAGSKAVFSFYIEANYVDVQQKILEEIEITREDEEKIREMARDPWIREKIIASIAPSIYGHWNIKEAIALQLFGGVPKILPDGTRIRGDIHVLLVGDPGTAKSQMLQYAARLAPRGIYTSGKGSSAAGLTASVLRDKHTGEWYLEAGALVLADGGIAAIDEIDKMREEDRSAIHEALEQQSYHPDFEIMLADGRLVKIGEYVDLLMEKNPDKILHGGETDVLFVDDVFLVGYDLYTYTPLIVRADRISRHVAPRKFVKLRFSNGREIVVTPEHPVIVFLDGRITVLPAEKIEPSMIVLGVKRYPVLAGNTIRVKRLIEKYGLESASLLIFKVLLGELTPEDIGELKDLGILNEDNLIKNEFLNELVTSEELIRRIITMLFTRKANISDCLVSLQVDHVSALLVQEILWRLGINSFIADRELIISGPRSLEKLAQYIIDEETRSQILGSSKTLKGYPDSWLEIVYAVAGGLKELIGHDLFKRIIVGDISETMLETMISGILNDLAKTMGDLRSHCVLKENYMLLLTLTAGQDIRKFFTKISDSLNKLKEVLLDIEERLGESSIPRIVVGKEIVENKGVKWVYDITIEPYHLFVSHGLVLHNTISIAKAGIVARLNARASVLAAGNPKFGRYDPKQSIGQNIDLPPPILSRFDLIFIIQDIPHEKRDRMLARHILSVHGNVEKAKPVIEPQLLKKYISYARRYVRPQLTQEAVHLLEEFFVSMRRASGVSEEAPIAITARQLEALVRLSEAHAKMALKNKVTIEDAEEAVRLMYYSLQRAGIDVETGRIDIDTIMVGTPRSKQERMKAFIRFIDEIFEETDEIEYKELVRKAIDKGFARDFTNEMLRKLKREGTIYEPKPGVIAKIK